MSWYCISFPLVRNILLDKSLLFVFYNGTVFLYLRYDAIAVLYTEHFSPMYFA